MPKRLCIVSPTPMIIMAQHAARLSNPDHNDWLIWIGSNFIRQGQRDLLRSELTRPTLDLREIFQRKQTMREKKDLWCRPNNDLLLVAM